MSPEHLNDVPADEQETVPAAEIAVGDFVYDPPPNDRWLLVEEIEGEPTGSYRLEPTSPGNCAFHHVTEIGGAGLIGTGNVIRRKRGL